MLNSPVTAGALLLGAILFSVYHYFKSDPNQHQYEYSPRPPPQPAIARPNNYWDSSCPICLGTERGEMRNLRCRHTFHNVCIRNWLRQGSRTCPVCREAVS